MRDQAWPSNLRIPDQTSNIEHSTSNVERRKRTAVTRSGANHRPRGVEARAWTPSPQSSPQGEETTTSHHVPIFYVVSHFRRSVPVYGDSTSFTAAGNVTHPPLSQNPKMAYHRDTESTERRFFLARSGDDDQAKPRQPFGQHLTIPVNLFNSEALFIVSPHFSSRVRRGTAASYLALPAALRSFGLLGVSQRIRLWGPSSQVLQPQPTTPLRDESR